MRLRPAAKQLHLWIGIIAGGLVSVVALTGSVIVFRTELELATVPAGAGAVNSSRRATLDDLARQISSARPDARIRQIRLPERSGDPYVVQIESNGKRPERLACDASTGQILGTIRTAWVDWLIDLHRNLLSGKPGRKVAGGAGIALFLMAATGLILWLAGARKWRAWVYVRAQGPARRFSFELHRATGLWAFGLLTVVSFTGIGLSYPDTFRQTLRWMTGQPVATRAPRIAKARIKGTPQPLPFPDEYVRAGKRAMPDGVPVELRLPSGGNGPVDLRLWRAGDLSPDGNRVYLDPFTANVLSVSKAAEQPLDARVFAAFAPIHYGEFDGLATKVLWGLLGLLPAALFATGIIAWWPFAKRASRPAVRKEELTLTGD